MMVKKLFCSSCKEEITTTDEGDNIKFEKDEEIICIKRKAGDGSLHFYNEDGKNDRLADEGMRYRKGRFATVRIREVTVIGVFK